MKNLCRHAHIWSKNRQFYQNNIILLIKKVNRMLFFFPIFHGKTPLSCPYFVNETFTLEKINCSQVHILSENLQSLKNTLWCLFFKFYTKNSLLSSPYLVKKTSILTKLREIMGTTSQKDVLFFSFRFLTKNNRSYAHILSKKRPFY